MPPASRSQDDRERGSQQWDRFTYAAAALAVLLVYGVAVHQLPKGVFLVPDDGGKYLILHSLRWTGTGLAYRLPYGGERIDPTARFYPWRDAPFPYPRGRADGQVDFHWPVWFPLLARPFHSLFGIGGIYVLPVLCGWLTAVAGGWLAGRRRSGLAAMATVIVGLATPVFFYSVTFWEHTAATLLGMVAVALCLQPVRASAYFAATACLVAATLLRIEMVVVAVALVIGCLATARRSPSPATAFTSSDPHIGWRRVLVPTLLLAFTGAVFWLGYPYLPHRLQEFMARLPQRLVRFSDNLINLPDGLAAILVNSHASAGPRFAWPGYGVVAVGLALVAPFLRPPWLKAACLFGGLGATCGLTAWLLLSKVPYLSMHGFFPMAPFCLLAPYAFVSAWRRGDPIALRLAAIGLVYLLIGVGAVFVILVGQDGQLKSGIEWGQRYLLTLYPLLTVLALIGVADYEHAERSRPLTRAVLALAAAAVLLGNGFELRALATADQELRVYATWDKALRRGEPVVTDASWLPATLADLFATQEMYVVESARHLGDWVEVARAHGVRRFLFASADDAKQRDFGTASSYRQREVQHLPRLLITPFEIPPPAARSRRADEQE